MQFNAVLNKQTLTASKHEWNYYKTESKQWISGLFSLIFQVDGELKKVAGGQKKSGATAVGFYWAWVGLKV